MTTFTYTQNPYNTTQTATELLREGKRVILLVPEQQLVQSEGMMAKAVSALGGSQSDTQQAEVLSFRRLCERVFREVGGLCYNYIGKGARVIVMRRVLDSIAPLLKQYSGAVDLAQAKEFSTFCTSLARAGVTSEKLKSHIKDIREQGKTALADKLVDIALVQDAFHGAIVADYDDPEEDLTRLSETLGRYDFFHDRHVLLEGFAGFTGQEFNVISAIMAQAAGVTFFWGRRQEDARHVMGKLHTTEERIKEIANDLGQEIIITPAEKAQENQCHPHLKLLHENMWADALTADAPHSTNSVQLLECATIAEESHAAAVAIMQNVMAGGRYCDHVITMRNWEDYAGVLDNTLRSFGIPFFVSQRAPLSGRAAVRVILSALQIHRFGWRKEDVIAYAKTGLTDLTESEVFLLEQYVRTWNISGAMWREEWTMNPEGYGISRENSQFTLEKLNDFRQRLVSPLIKFSEDFGQRVSEQSEAIFTLLTDLNVASKLAEIAQQQSGAAAQETAQVWNYICDALDQLVAVAGDMKVDGAEYSAMLSLLIQEADIGRIPGAVDQVVIADALLLRAYDKKQVHVMGAAESMFPKKAEAPPLLSRGELSTLAEIGIELAADSIQLMAEECFLFLSAAAIPTEKLLISYPSKTTAGEHLDPSIIIEAVQEVFAQQPIVNWRDIPAIDKAFGPVALALLAKCDTIPVIHHDNSIAIAASRLYSGDIRLSHSQLNAFARCPRQHACRYPLRLKTPQYEQSPSLIAGEIMHFLLEDFFRENATAPIDFAMAQSADKFCRRVTGVSLEQAKNRHVALYQLLRRQMETATLVVRDILEELAGSTFKPALFELAFGGKNASLPPVTLPLGDGTNGVLSGVLDRVDIAVEGQQIAVRICDYKSSDTSFSYEDMKLGLSLQLPLYLHALQANKDRLGQLIGLPQSEIIPAGALYYTAKRPSVSVGSGLSEQEIWEKAQKNFTRNGISLNGADLGATKAFSVDDFSEILTQSADVVATLAADIKSGNATACPVQHKTINPCEFCDYRVMCDVK